MNHKQNLIQELSKRSQVVFRNLVDSYIATGDPVGSQSIANSLAEDISPATIRNIMQDLESRGVLNIPKVYYCSKKKKKGNRLFLVTHLGCC